MRVGGDGGDDERHQSHIHGVEGPTDARRHEQFAMRLVERQAVESFVACERGRFGIGERLALR